VPQGGRSRGWSPPVDHPRAEGPAGGSPAMDPLISSGLLGRLGIVSVKGSQLARPRRRPRCEVRVTSRC
jgi:hypothetical protein